LKTTTLNTWSPLSNVTVRLKPSRDYLRLLVLVHGFAVIALLQTACPTGLIAALACVLAAHGSYLWRRKTPGARCSELNYAKESWLILEDTTGELVVYDEAYVRFDFGWLIWLVFKNASKLDKTPRRDVLLFQDQISPDEHRLLRLVLRVNYKKVKKRVKKT
jgi:hypothetical protein